MCEGTVDTVYQPITTQTEEPEAQPRPSRIWYVDSGKANDLTDIETTALLMAKIERQKVEQGVIPGPADAWDTRKQELRPITAQSRQAREPHIMGMGRKRVIVKSKRFGRWSKR